MPKLSSLARPLVALLLLAMLYYTFRAPSSVLNKNPLGYPTPGLATDAIVARVSSNGPELLLVKRKHAPYKGMHAFPGGFVDLNEDPRAACVRELREETGLKMRYDPINRRKVDRLQDDSDDSDDPNDHSDEEERILARTTKLIAVNGSPTIDPRGHTVSIVYAVRLGLFLPGKLLTSSSAAKKTYLDSLRGHDDAADLGWVAVDDIKSGKVELAFSHGDVVLHDWLPWWEREGKHATGDDAWHVPV